MTRVDPLERFRGELPLVEKPARYLGGEIGSSSKPDADYNVALCFPDLYEIGMSNNAMRILYSGLNALDGVSCARVFSVDADFQGLLSATGTPLYCLDSGLAVRDADMLAVTVGYELAATNIIGVLESSGIPVRKADRGQGSPLVIAGGPAITNPAPYAKILDAVWIGEAEDEFFDLVAALRAMKLSGASRDEMLARVLEEAPVWVPGKKAARHIYEGFGERRYGHAFPLPILKPVQDHGVVEIMRGCPNGCRFCHAGYFYRPSRLRAREAIFADVADQIEIAGHKEISLTSLSSGDYPGIVSLVEDLNAAWKSRGVSFQLPSLKVESFPLEVLESLANVRQSGLTFAVETPLEQWQLLINKTVSLDKVKSILSLAEEKGYRVAKFYFMIGLPVTGPVQEETAIIDFLKDVVASTRLKINVTVSTFVPKPHTPFQWSAQLGLEESSRTIYGIKDAFRKNARVKITYHAPYLSWLEGIVSRGDERVGDLLLAAYSRGARFDAWEDKFSKDAWTAAIAEWGVDPETYLAERDVASALPWDDISLRVSKKYLRSEYERSREPLSTERCSGDCDHPCGACSDDCGVEDLPSDSKEIIHPEASERAAVMTTIAGDDGARVRARLLLRYEKRGSAAFIPHHSVHGLLAYALERSGVILAYSEGFNPQPRLEISEPLPLGFDSFDEYALAITLASPGSMTGLVSRLNAHLPAGIRVLEAKPLAIVDGVKALSLSALYWGSSYRISLPGRLDAGVVAAALSRAMAGEPLLAAGTAARIAGTTIEVLAPFAGKKEYGIQALFASCAGISIRDAKAVVSRTAQFARTTDNAPTRYFDRLDA